MKYKNLVITQNAKLFQSIRPILICADLDVSQATKKHWNCYPVLTMYL